MAASAFLIFGVMNVLAGYIVLAVSLALAFVIDRSLASDLVLIAVGLVIISTISVEANLDYPNMALFGTVLALAVAVPFLIDRYLYKRRTIVFPIRTGQKWTPLEKWYFVIVLVLGWAILPFYFIRSGAYQNWPSITAPDEIGRLLVGVSYVGIWDELFFICTVFAVLRRHFPMWQANILQSVIFVSFLWETRLTGSGDLCSPRRSHFCRVTSSRARNRSPTWSACTCCFDLVVFLVLVHAHKPAVAADLHSTEVSDAARRRPRRLEPPCAFS